MSEPRTYGLGLPVTMYVHDDGRVFYSVDLSEAGRLRDLFDSQEGLDPEDQYPDATVEADAEIIQQALNARSSPFTNPLPVDTED